MGDTLAELVTPVPDRAAVWGLPVPLSVTVTAAVRAPVAVGLNVALMAHWAPAARLDPQVFVWAKSPLLVPVRLTAWGVLEALSLIVSVPVRVPVAVGLKVTLMVQLPPAATELPQLSVSAKSPLTAMLLMARLTVPPLVRVAALAVLVVPTA